MARALRIEYPGAVYHVMARGNQGHDIFQDDADRRCFRSRWVRLARKPVGWFTRTS